VLRRHNEVVRQHVAACGGYEVKSQGDGFMIAFAGAAKALRCATGIQRSFAEDARLHPDSPVRVRIGLHTGEALRVDDDFHGNAVNLASRIAGTAVGGEILVSSLLRELTEGSGEFTFGEPRRVTLKGFDGERDVYPLGWAETADA
jgi:class 3 adenylate cyclase